MPAEVDPMHRAVLAVALAPLQLAEGGVSCRHPLASMPCLLVWLNLSLPFFAAGGL